MSLVPLMVLAASSLGGVDEVIAPLLKLGVSERGVTRLADPCTGEGFDAPSPRALIGMWRGRDVGIWADAASVQTRREPAGLHLTCAWNEPQGRSQLDTHFAVQSDGDVLVTQEGRSGTPGLSGIQWGWAVPDTWDVLAPGTSGQRIAKGSPYDSRVFEYPIEWEAQFVLIQGRRGGILIFAEDRAERYKALRIEHRPGQTLIGLETRCTAPFTTQKDTASVRWRIHPYQGDWLVGAAVYRQWAEKAFELIRIDQKTPDWAKDIQFVATMGLEQIDVLKALARHIKPSQTLLYVPNWRKSGYDRNYPDYTPIEGFEALMKRAQGLGYRVMLHVNYFGCTQENPEYARLEPFHCLDPFSGAKLNWDWTRATPPIKFAYINPASRVWREVFIARMREVVNRLHADALHLDQTLCIFNDGRGLIDGMNMMQGNLALHRELREALPDVALSGEGLNEITCRFEAFAQRHVWGIDHADGQWNPSLIAMAHPISSAIVANYTTIYGYLGMPNPEPTDYYLAWRSAYEQYGVIPTLCWPRTTQLADPPAVVRSLLSEAQFFQREQPRPDFSPGSSPDTIVAYRTARGGRAEYRREPAGVSLRAWTGATADSEGQVIARRITGATTARLPGRIDGWWAYDESDLIGLDPRASYAYVDEPRDPNVFHVVRLPAETVLRRVGLRPAFAVIELEDLRAEVANLSAFSGTVRSGETLRDGTVHQESCPAFRAPTGSMVAPTGESLLVHPPFIGQYINMQGPAQTHGLGHVWTEFEVRLPADRPAFFKAGIGLRVAEAVDKSDGLTYRVSAEDTSPSPQSVGSRPGPLRAERHARSAEPEPLMLDLSALKGRTVRLRLEATPGAAGSVNYDWGIWVRPRVILKDSRHGEVDVLSPRSIVGAASGVEPVEVTSRGDRRYTLKMPLPGAAYLLFEKPQPITLPADVPAMTFSNALVLRGGREERPEGFCDATRGASTVGGVARSGLFAHPPNQGQQHVDFVMALPGSPARLTGFAGIRDGADGKGRGVGFRIAVNGRELWRSDVLPGKPWLGFDVPLAAYAGRTVVLTLITDALGDYGWDWAHWADVRLIAAAPGTR